MKMGDSAVEEVEVIQVVHLVQILLWELAVIQKEELSKFIPESSGKTTLTMHAIAESQKAGGIAAFIDAEHAF